MHLCYKGNWILIQKILTPPDIAVTFCNHVGIALPPPARPPTCPCPPPLQDHMGEDRISMRITWESPVPAPTAADSYLVRVTLTWVPAITPIWHCASSRICPFPKTEEQNYEGPDIHWYPLVNHKDTFYLSLTKTYCFLLSCKRADITHQLRHSTDLVEQTLMRVIHLWHCVRHYNQDFSISHVKYRFYKTVIKPRVQYSFH